MDPQRWQQIERLYHSALEREAAERKGLLLDACQGDADLLREVESLLSHSDSTGALVDRTAWAAVEERVSAQKTLKAQERLGPYQIVGLLGTGGMGEVYSAVDTRLGRKVAIKICQERFSGRFEREARAISALNHPNICTLHDIGPNYLVTELVEGETLRDFLQRPATLERSLEIAKQVLEALRAAHREGIVHRDLKPQNIMVRFDGYVKVLDFGLAKRMLAASAAQAQITATAELSVSGQLLGTVAYMSPEQILGQEVDQRSDLFAFGIILYEMLTGRRPWPSASPVDTLHAILHDEAQLTDQLPLEIASVVQRLLRKIPGERYASAEAVLEAFAAPSGSSPPVDTAKPLTSIAVLPFVFLSEVEERKALSLGFADALITMLGGLEDFAVTPTTAILNYAAPSDPAHTCRDLGVRHVLQGKVQKFGSRWRVSIQLFDGMLQKTSLSEKYDFVLEDIFDVQDEMGRHVVQSLQSRFPRALPTSRDRYSSNPEAYNEYMLGFSESYSDKEPTVRSAVQHLTRAVEHDPEFALAHAILAYDAMQIRNEFDAHRSWLEMAERHCRRALEIDPELPEAHSARAFILFSPARNFQAAEAIAALEKVLEAQPNNERAHNRMANICLHIGRMREALLAHQRARQSNPKTRANNLEFILLASGDFARAEEAAEAWIREKPGTRYALWFHPMPALMLGRLDVAEQRLAAGLKLFPNEPLLITLQGVLHARRGESELALQCVRRALDFPHSFGHTHHVYEQISAVYAVLGDAERAMVWLEKSVDTGNSCWPYFKVNPHFENLRGEPRFQRLIADLEREYTALKIERA